jgi:hypothetical protein
LLEPAAEQQFRAVNRFFPPAPLLCTLERIKTFDKNDHVQTETGKNSMENRVYFTIGQASTETGKAKSTIKKSIDSGELTVAERTKRGFKIEASELFRVFPRKQEERSTTNDHVQTETVQNTIENSILKAKLELADQRYSDAEETIKDLREQRDKWHEQAKANSLLLVDQRQQPEPRKGILARIADRFIQ